MRQGLFVGLFRYSLRGGDLRRRVTAHGLFGCQRVPDSLEAFHMQWGVPCGCRQSGTCPVLLDAGGVFRPAG